VPIVARLSSGFGWRADPFGGDDEWHAGLDFPAPYGAPVRATAEGEVEFAEWRNGYGLAVSIRHPDGYTTLFGHLSAASVRAGERVTRGTVIGRVGNEGRSTGPHVHYEVRRYGKPVDPRRVRLAPASAAKDGAASSNR
jgi:murein DD-endopeptidase MepM/ murein hydrolase activator NlpD